MCVDSRNIRSWWTYVCKAEIETHGGRMYGPQGGGEWDEVRGWDWCVYTATLKQTAHENLHSPGESAQCSWRSKWDGNPKKKGHVSHRADSLCCAVETTATLSRKYMPIKKKVLSDQKTSSKQESHIHRPSSSPQKGSKGSTHHSCFSLSILCSLNGLRVSNICHPYN